MGRSVSIDQNALEQKFGSGKQITGETFNQYNKEAGGNLRQEDFNDYNMQQQRKSDEQAAQKAREEQARVVAQQKQDMINLHGEQSRDTFNKTLGENKKSAQSRGLLYSGIKQGADYGAAGNQASDEAGYAQRVNQSSEGQLNDLKNQSAQAGLQSYGNDIQHEQTLYNDALERKKSNPAGAIGSALGNVASKALPF